MIFLIILEINCIFFIRYKGDRFFKGNLCYNFFKSYVVVVVERMAYLI